MKYLKITLPGLLFLVGNIYAQTDTLIYFQSLFETVADQQQWQSLPADPDKKWTFQTGGDLYNPEYAYEGDYNAFFWWSDFNPVVRNLMSPKIDLSDSKKPQLSFAHAMVKSFFGTDKLALVFKAGSSAPWDTIIKYTTEVKNWTIRDFNIKDFGTKYLCKDFQFAFVGTAQAGHGICIDSVMIVEKDIIFRHPKYVEIKEVKHDLIPTGATDLPVMRVDIPIIGNTNQAILDSISFISLSSSDDLFATNGFELVATKDSVYRPTYKGASLKIGTAVSIVNGVVTFNHLNYNLPTGFNCIWLIADINASAPHKSTVDFKVTANAIKINSTKYPAAEVSPAGVNTIEHAVFYDNFEGASSWTLQSDFEIAVPKGYVAYITTDPDFAYSGTKEMGTDLTVDGKYRLNINAATAYYATSPVINLKYYDDVKLNFKKWIAFEGNDEGVIEVSVDTAKTWHRIWDSKEDAQTPDYGWNDLTFTSAFDAVASRHEWVKVRFGVIYSDNSFAYAGFNIDNIAVTGKYLTNDVGIINILKPVNDCFNPGMDSVDIVVRNWADGPSASTLPVFFSIYGNDIQKVTGNITGPIAKDGSKTYRFPTPANFPLAGDYKNFKVVLQVPGDQDADNDTAKKDIYIQQSNAPPYLEKFETGGGYWRTAGESPTWLCKVPDGSIPVLTGSPNSWILSPYGNYINGDTSYVESGCYDLSSGDRCLFKMSLWMDSEPGKDGANIQYTTDEGLTWHLLDVNEFGWNWGWYNTGNITSLGQKGWSGINSTGWMTVTQLLPASLKYEPKVRFRVKWASDEQYNYRGMAFDNINIIPAPYDIGVTQINSPVTRCLYLNPDQVTVTIKNLGVNAMKQNDTIIVGYDFNHVHADIDTFKLTADLPVGSAIQHTFASKVDIDQPGNYNITAYTLIEDDPYYYFSNNDTASLNFTVLPLPLTQMLDTIQTKEPDTVVIRPYFNPNYDYLWNDASTLSIYDVDKGGWYSVTVTATRGNGCSTKDSTYVELLFYDLGIDSLIYPINHCGLGKNEFVVARVKNFGTDSIQAGENIRVAFRFNNGTPVVDTMQLQHSLYTRHTINYTFTKGAVDLSAKGFYNFKLYSDFGSDTIHVNDTTLKQIEIYGHPTVNIGPDKTVQALSYTLDAGPGFTSYLWDNGAITQAREVTETGTSWVLVYDENHCDDYDSAYIRLKIRDIRPNGLTSPLSACTFDPALPVSLRILNSGTDTVPAGSNIDVSYIIDGGDTISESFNLSSQLLPNANLIHSFPGTVDMSSVKDYFFVTTVGTANDLRPFNDTMNQTIYRYPKPNIDFGLNSSEIINDIQYTLDAGYSPYYGYLWQDNSTEPTYTAINSGTFRVLATDYRTGCSDGDTVTIFLIYNDVGITYTDMQSAGCSGDYRNVKVRVRNMGTTNIGKDAPIYVACDVNGTRVTIDTLVRSGNFVTNSNIDLLMSGAIPVSQEGINQVDFYTIYADDMKSWDDSLFTQFDALPSPVIDFGDVNGVLVVSLPYDLDAGAGQKDYLWQDNSTLQTYHVTSAGTYGVTVTGQNDCVSHKTVRINPGTGLGDLPDGNVSVEVYPNPSDGMFNLLFKMDKPQQLTLEIINNLGQIVYRRILAPSDEINESFNLTNMALGIYHLRIYGDRPVYNGKLVIQ